MKHWIFVAALALLLPGCVQRDRVAAAGPPAIRMGFISEPGSSGAASPEQAAAQLAGVMATMADPPRHPTHPARNRQLVIPSGPVLPALGRPAEMNALMLQAAGPGPHPTLLLLHGLPGNERNLDLAQAARRAGWNVLTFTYRGAWGSEGTFSVHHAVADTEAALAWLRSDAAARDYGVNPDRIVVAGHSMGGYLAARVARESERPGGWPLAGLILIDAWDIADTGRQLEQSREQGRAAFLASFDDIGHALGPITAADIYENVRGRWFHWDLNDLAPDLTRLPTLVIYATRGLARRNRAFADLYLHSCRFPIEDRPCPTLTAIEMDTDHAFADHRVALAREVVGWLVSRAND